MKEIFMKEGLNFVKGKVKLEKIKRNLVKMCELVIAGEGTKDFKIKYPLEWKIWNDKELKLKSTIYDAVYDNDPTYNKRLEVKIQEIKSGVYDEQIKLNK